VLLTTLELLLADDTPPAEHSALIALQSSAGSLGDTAGPVLMGVIYGAAGGSVTFFVAAGVAALMLVLTFRMLG
jgi:predicted MFS family arabinose efflux permease